MCRWALFGRLVSDPPFEKVFFSDPYKVARELGATRTEAQALASLAPTDFQQLSHQLAAIRAALGTDATKRLSTSFGLQFALGRALTDPGFAQRVQADAAGALSVMLGHGESAKQAAAVFASAEYARLNGFAAQRLAMQAAGARFAASTAHGAAKAVLRESLLREIQAEERAKMAPLLAPEAK